MTNLRSGNPTMSSDNDRQPKSKSKKRRHIVVSETDSSDECDSPTTKSRRKQRINKIRNDIKKITKETKAEVEASCSSHSVNDDKKSSEKQVNGKISSDISDGEIVPNNDLISSQTVKSPKNPEENENAIVAISESNENDKKNENTQGVEKCPICWAPFEHQEIAIPLSCDHRFCFDCIMKWSKNTNTCPVDRLEFNKVEVRPNISAKPTLYVQIPPTIQHNDTEDEDLAHFVPEAFTSDEDASSSQGQSDGVYPVFSPDEDDEDEEEEERYSTSTNDYNGDDVDANVYEDEFDEDEGEEGGGGGEEEEEDEDEEEQEDEEDGEEDQRSSSTHQNELSSSPINHDDDVSIEDDFWRTSGSDINHSSPVQMSDEPSSAHSAASYHFESSIMDSSNSPAQWDSSSPATSLFSSPSSLSSSSSSSSLSYSS